MWNERQFLGMNTEEVFTIDKASLFAMITVISTSPCCLGIPYGNATTYVIGYYHNLNRVEG